MRELRTGEGWGIAFPDERLLPLGRIEDDKYYIIEKTSYDITNGIMNVTLEEVEIKQEPHAALLENKSDTLVSALDKLGKALGEALK